MWYVIQVFSGEEEKTANMIKDRVSESLIEECFIPKKEKIKKFHGCWHKVEEIVFPGYIFAVTDRPEEVYQELKKVSKMTRLLGEERQYFIPLTEEEEKFVRDIGDNEHKTRISQVQIQEGKRIKIIDGPLKNYEGSIIKVNLHKREVVIRVDFMQKQVDLHLGIEMG